LVRIKCTEDFKQLRAVIKVIGLGGAGGNAVNRMVEAGVKDVELIAANSDAQVLGSSKAHVRIQLGEEYTRGLGVGGDPAKGRLAALESKEQLHEVLTGADLVFVTTGMGGGTGTGSAPVAAQIAKDSNALTIGVVTRPFHFESRDRAQKAEMGIKELRNYVDALLVIPNDRLFEVIEEGTTTEEAYRRADDVLRQAVQSLSDVITQEGAINMDLNDIKAIMTGAGEALMGVGEASGPNRAIDAAKEAITSPLLENMAIDGAKGLIVNIVGNRKVEMSAIKEVMEFVSRSASPEAKVKFGQVYDDSMGDTIRVTVVATGFPPRHPRSARRLGTLTGNRASTPSFGPAPGMSAPNLRPGSNPTAPEDWGKPAFLRWKVRKLR
jgi:cell division protein FtsZ